MYKAKEKSGKFGLLILYQYMYFMVDIFANYL